MSTSEDTLQYSLLRGSEQVTRVNINQYVWRETLGYLLHPKIPQDVLNIADVAAATGLWLSVLDHTRPNQYEALDGYDISSKSFLLPRDRPTKVKLEALDATKEVPVELRGKYDVVHVRLVLPGILDGDPSRVIQHCKDLLKPGGYLQWEEFDVTDYKVHVEHGVARPSNLEQALKTFSGGSPKGWIAKLPEILQTHGMSPLAVERKREPPWHRTTMTHTICGVLTEISRARLDVDGPPGAGANLRAIIQAALSENLAGSYISSLFQVVVAQKQ